MRQSLKYLRRFERPRIKLGAIAKDEAAYLPMWILHHLRAGFDHIEIYANLIEDNTYEIAEKISRKYPISVVEADFLYGNMSEVSFQREAYRRIYESARDENFTYLMLLDIDEFFVSKVPGRGVLDFIRKQGHPDIGCFQWANRCSDCVEFGLPLDEVNILRNNEHVKTMFRTELNVQDIDIHNIVSYNSDYILADGIYKNNEAESIVEKNQFDFEKVKDFFVLHRMYRSKMEYVSTLGRGQSSDKSLLSADELLIKVNRFGYDLIDTPHPEGVFVEFRVPAAEVREFRQAYADFVTECQLEEPLKKAQAFIAERARRVMKRLPEIGKVNAPLVERLMTGIDVGEIEQRLKI